MRPATEHRPGFALPLALAVMLSLAMLVALLLDAALEDLRQARGTLAEAHARAAVDRALAVVLRTRLDSAVAGLPRGAVRLDTLVDGGDTARIAVQALGGGLARLVVRARARREGARADAGAMAFVRLEVDTTAIPVTVRPRRLDGPWWAPIP